MRLLTNITLYGSADLTELLETTCLVSSQYIKNRYKCHQYNEKNQAISLFLSFDLDISRLLYNKKLAKICEANIQRCQVSIHGV